jgi:hypothetical protein
MYGGVIWNHWQVAALVASNPYAIFFVLGSCWYLLIIRSFIETKVDE